MRSLLAPLVLGLVLSLVAVFGVQWSAVRSSIDGGMKDYIAGELAQDADELSMAIVLSESGGTTLAVAHVDPSYLSPLSGRYYQILLDDHVALRSPSLADQSLPMTRVQHGNRAISKVTGPNEQSLLMSAAGYDIGGHRITIGIATDLQPVKAELDVLLSRYSQVSVAMFALLVVLQIVIVRLALAPLRRVQADVGRLERGETEQLRESVPIEILPLVREVNRLLAILAQRLRRSRESLGNLAHALKAPLTVLTHIASDEHIRRQPVLAAQMSEQVEILRNRIDSELRRARIAAGRAPGPAIDFAAEINSLLATMQKLYRDRNLQIECRLAPRIVLPGDREDLLEMCGNLLDNACKWARSRVVISVHRGQGTLMAIEDDGPGCSREDLRTLAQRVVRLDESTPGHGLGLAIARNVALSNGATIEFGRSEELGGFRVSVNFPST